MKKLILVIGSRIVLNMTYNDRIRNYIETLSLETAFSIQET